MAAKTTAAPAEGEAPAKKKKLPLLIGAVVLLVVVAAGAWFFLLKPDPAAAAEAEHEEPEAGEVVTLDPVSINLADGAYLRLGLALQQTADAAHEADGSIALDQAIALFSGRSKEELADPAVREELKTKLTEDLAAPYHEEVYKVYFTEFVTQ